MWKSAKVRSGNIRIRSRAVIWGRAWLCNDEGEISGFYERFGKEKLMMGIYNFFYYEL